MMTSYTLRLTLKDSELILEYRERDSEKYVFAVGCDCSDPAQALAEFVALRALQVPGYAVLQVFREFNCVIPDALRPVNSVLLMNEHDFIEL